MADQELVDLIRKKLPEKRSNQERTDFVFNLLITGRDKQEIIDGFFLNGISREETANYIKISNDQLEKINSQSLRSAQRRFMEKIDEKIINFLKNLFNFK